MGGNWKAWRHITKLDPDKYVSPQHIERVIDSGTDALMVSGTQNVTRAKVDALLEMLEDYDIPKVIEPSTPDAVVYDVDYVFVPSVLNAQDIEWVVGKHQYWLKKFEVDWSNIVPEAYIVLNPRSIVGKVTKARTELSAADVAAYARCAEKYFKFPIIYIEYSGSFGDPAIVKAVKDSLEDARLYYGGGIDAKAKAETMAEYADTIIVGNIVYEDIDKATETVIP